VGVENMKANATARYFNKFQVSPGFRINILSAVVAVLPNFFGQVPVSGF
jgi:hypothetical protein